MKESDSIFKCPDGTVMTGRFHKEDENGLTKYEYANLVSDPNGNLDSSLLITIDDPQWSDYFAESSGYFFKVEDGRVITGREHLGDENGNTRFQTSAVKVNNSKVTIVERSESEGIKESDWVWWRSSTKQVMTGRCHMGDENGNTRYEQGFLLVELPPRS